MRPRRSAPHAPRILGVLLALVPSIAAAVEAVDRENRACLETALSGVTWRGTNQLYCLKPDPRRTRRDPFGRCQERHYEVTLKNSCAFLIEVRWRFENETASRYRTLGPHQAFTVECAQISDQCEGSIVAVAEKVAN